VVVVELQEEFAVSERRACRVLDQPRSSQRYESQPRDDEAALVKRMRELVRAHPRYSYRFITAKLRQEGWRVNAKRVHRLWRREGLKVPRKKRKRRRLGSSENACQRRRAEHRDHVWCWGFIVSTMGQKPSPSGETLRFIYWWDGELPD
jgi:transposase InsO family protein